ncbi:sensor histidine kinase [Streptomyces sp. NPDC006012]|uniref:sensor histidine kinase n=1 Tax=Streptomyces sp. NPDC006012 TaxID=3364739 RepID=UPI00368B04E6
MTTTSGGQDRRRVRLPGWANSPARQRSAPGITAAPPSAAPGPEDIAVPGTPAPEKLQLRALQAMCRQVFGFRLAMIVLAAPAALLNASPGLGARLVGAAVVITFMVSYVLFRDWQRFGPLLLRHPTLLAADTLTGSLLLVSAGPDTTLAYVSVCTPLLAGLLYDWRGAACFASLQSLILLLVHATLRQGHPAGVAESLLLPGLCVITGAMGSALRNVLLRFGAATQALTTVQARLAATDAVTAERVRLAREMHDSVAKTLYGVALAADGLAASAAAGARTDPALIEQQAQLVSRSARRAAAEARELLTDLRRDRTPGDGDASAYGDVPAYGDAPAYRTPSAPGDDTAPDRTTPAPGNPPDPDPTAIPTPGLLADLAVLVADFRTRTGLPAGFRRAGDRELPPVPAAVARHLRSIVSEALENAHRHGAPAHVDVRADVHADRLRLSVHDDGRGLPPGTTLVQLRHSGHFGLVGMAERAASVGARLRIGPGPHARGTEVVVDLPLTRPTTPPPTPDATQEARDL